MGEDEENSFLLFWRTFHCCFNNGIYLEHAQHRFIIYSNSALLYLISVCVSMCGLHTIPWAVLTDISPQINIRSMLHIQWTDFISVRKTQSSSCNCHSRTHWQDGEMEYLWFPLTAISMGLRKIIKFICSCKECYTDSRYTFLNCSNFNTSQNDNNIYIS